MEEEKDRQCEVGGSAIKLKLKYKHSERNRIYTEVHFYIHQLILVPETTHYFGHLLIQWLQV